MKSGLKEDTGILLVQVQAGNAMAWMGKVVVETEE